MKYRLIDFFKFKKIDWYVLKSYIGPFLATFLIAWFVVIMQFLWKYIDDMIGKGLSTMIILKLIYYMALTLIPMALPIAVLLSSIMTMGRFGEHFELSAAKASGISLFRFFKSLIFFSFFLSIFAFYFANFVLTEVKNVADSMLQDVRNLKPALLIKPKTFYNGIAGVSIRIEEKNEKTGDLFNLKIYNHQEGKGNENILMAQKGTFKQSEDGKVLIMRLDSGVRYTEEASNNSDNPKFPFYKVKFKSYEKRFDLTQFKLNDKFGKSSEDRRFMLTANELNKEIDTFESFIAKKNKEMSIQLQSLQINLALVSKNNLRKVNLQDSLKKLSPDQIKQFRVIATNKARNIKNNIYVAVSEITYNRSLQNLFKVEWHFKYTFALSCLVLFFVGAPLGAIIKKGGLGWPMLISVVLFIIYLMSNISIKKICENEALLPWIGMWIPTVVFGIFGFYLTIKAKNDSALLDFDSYQMYFVKLKNKLKKRK